MSYLINLIKNLLKFLKVAAVNKNIHWNSITSNAEDNCFIHVQSKIYGPYHMKEVKIGKGSYISPNANISFTSIGKFCSIGPNLVCGWGIHPLDGISTSPIFYSTLNQAGFTYSKEDKIAEHKFTNIGNDVFIGANVTILDGVSIGDGAVIGAGAVVSKDIPPYAIAVGCPIKILRHRFSPEIIESLLQTQWWEKDEEALKDVEKYFFNTGDFIRKYNK